MITEAQFSEFQRWACAKSSRTLKITFEHDYNGDPRTEIWAYDSEFMVGQLVEDASQIDLPKQLIQRLEQETARLRALTETTTNENITNDH